ncbi:uncharacterized protein LOC129944750 [Eupeodes corollae]|uniref:uncharacterized protein LOC129944750 n=1 Tax=Eupeodes corollae TaxID=290404 RepID=UPI00249321B7|nr:uncharacterized protein LOC129944750 [Eupeodes corollae]
MKNTKTEDCFFQSESSFQELLFAVKDGFQKHLELFKTNLDVQINVIDSMWVISQRFLILTRGAVCMCSYPQEQCDREEREIRAGFKLKRKELHKSNYTLSVSLEDLKQMCQSFDKALTNTIDPSLPSQIIEGNNERKPIYFYIEFYADFFKFLRDIQNQLTWLKPMLYVDDIKSILEYKNHLQPNKTELDYFEKSLYEFSNQK